MSQVARPGQLKQAKDERTTYVAVSLVIAISLLFGLLALPRVGRRESPTGGLAPEFSLPIAAGGDADARVSLSAYRGQVVVLDFWATWCGPCAEQARILEQFVGVARRELVVVGINEGEDLGIVQAHFDKHAAAYPIVLDSDERIGQSFSIRGLPTLVIIDRGGRISAAVSGVVPYARLERLVVEAAKVR